MSQRTKIAGLTFAAAAALALAIALAGLGRTRDAAQDSPVAAARDFVTDAVVDHNGFEACGYLTPEQQRAAWRRVGGGECRQAFDEARLTLGRHHIETVYQVEHLTAESLIDGDRARVRLTRAGASIDIRLVKANAAELEEFQAPYTEWRIAGGALALIPLAAKWGVPRGDRRPPYSSIGTR